jgi:hypothetical protein
MFPQFTADGRSAGMRVLIDWHAWECDGTAGNISSYVTASGCNGRFVEAGPLFHYGLAHESLAVTARRLAQQLGRGDVYVYARHRNSFPMEHEC